MGSSQQAVHFATQAVMSGTSDVVIAGGVQNMNMIPISFAMTAGQQLGFDTLSIHHQDGINAMVMLRLANLIRHI